MANHRIIRRALMVVGGLLVASTAAVIATQPPLSVGISVIRVPGYRFILNGDIEYPSSGY